MEKLTIAQMNERVSKIDSVDAVMTIESDDDATAQDQLIAWASLIKSGVYKGLQGFYQRGAQSFFESGVISKDGKILKQA